MTTIETLDDLTGDQPIRVKLRFCGSEKLGNKPYTEDAVYISRTGEGETARITFETRALHRVGCRWDRVGCRWEAYRYEGQWAYGTSAEPLRLVSIQD